MKDTLVKIADIIERYQTGEWQSVDSLRVMLRDLSACHYYLTKDNIIYAQEHNKAIYQFDGSDVKGLRFAELTVPQLRESRKILYTVNININSMRSELSIIKNES